MQDITKIDVIGNINFNWLMNWNEYKEIKKILLKVFPKEDWILNFRYNTKIGGWEVETLYSFISTYDIERLNNAFEGSIYKISLIGFNYDFLDIHHITPNLCITIDYRI